MNHDYIGSFWQCQMSQKTNQGFELSQMDVQFETNNVVDNVASNVLHSMLVC